MTRPMSRGTAAEFLVSRLYCDAVFNQDIRAIQLIISRIDGGVPTDEQVSEFKTMFGDCLGELMCATRAEQLMVYPEDTVMEAMCKSLFDLATMDIYAMARERGRRKPSTDLKNDRDAAMRMILERVGGRRTHSLEEHAEEIVEEAGWLEGIRGQLPA